MRQTSYTDKAGRKWAVMLPDSYSDAEASLGLHIGPPSLAPLGLPEEIEVRIHNQLFERGLLTANSIVRRNADIIGALQSALKVDAIAIAELYVQDSPPT